VLGVLVRPSTSGRILIVEDDAVLADVTRALLEEHGYQVQAVSRGADAVTAARDASPALMILDLGLPDRDGVAVVAELAEDRRTSQIPVLFLSGQENLATRVRAFRDLRGDFLRKPYGEEELLARIERCLADADTRAKLVSDARTDELTGLGNLRLLEERLQVETARRQRYGTPLTLVVVDVDRLKTINDTHGHLVGSAVLRGLGQALRAEIRETDVAFRYGGDEFVVLLPHTGLPDAGVFAERLLGRIRSLRPGGVPVTVSIGLATSGQEGSVQAQLARADAAAYAAKRDGGDRVVVDDRCR
jgi:diguanylate cyclase (GGDEF)-like protein